MWFMMSVAMMLPSAAPMIRTYCELADTAGRQRQKVVHPLVLICGYLAVWLAASVLFSCISVLVQWLGDGSSRDLGYRFAAAALAFAGLYQFSRLKNACLEKCRNPFATLFSRWSARTAGIFRLGLEQGLWCLGCCWALMLVMFAVGLMNVFWMALLGVFALAEKQLAGALVSRVAGAILLVWSATLLVLSL
jgi:predicted metal-binding membrane protein